MYNVRELAGQGLKALVIDDSQTDAQTLSYLLVKKLGCQVEIANSGLDGLNQLADGSLDLVFLDLNMPVVDGIEVFREIRDCEKTAHLPVVVISATTDPKMVRSVIELKPFDYVIKPYHAEKLVKRFAEKFVELRARRVVPVSMQLSGDEAVRDPGKEIILVVDDDSNFRHFFASTLGSQFHVVEASNGAQAIALALKYCPAYIFAGSAIGVFGRARMADKLRALPNLAGLRVYAVDKDGEASTEPQAIYDGRVKRTFVASTFLESVARCFSSGSVKPASAPSLRQLHQSLISATEQVFGMMMSTEVCIDPEHSEFDPAKACDIHGNIELFGYQESRRMAIHVYCERACIVVMAMRMLQMDQAEANSNLQLAESSLAEILTIIGARVNQYLGEEHREFLLGLPSVESQSQSQLKGSTAQEFGAYFSFEGGHRFYLAMGTQSLPASTVAIANLAEGMVLAGRLDIGGGMPLGKGRRLDAATIAKIKLARADNAQVFDDVKPGLPG